MKRYIIFMYILISISASGCWDKVELEEIGYVAAVGIDKGGRGPLSITFQIQNPQVGSSERAKAENEPAYEIITVEANDILSAKDTVSANTARRLEFAHANALIISEEFAKSEKCYDYLGEILRDREMRGDVNFIVCRERASEFIRNINPALETRPIKFYELMTKRWNESGITPISNLHLYLQLTEQDVSLFQAIYATTRKDIEKKFGLEDEYLAGEIDIKSDNPMQFIGSAVFKEGKMIGTFNGEETRLTNLLRPGTQVSGIMAVLKDPIDKGNKITARLYKEKQPKIKVDLKGSKPKIDVTVFVSYKVVLIPSHIDYVENLENQKLLKGSTEKFVGDKLQKLVERTQTEMGGDAFMWGNVARRKFLTYDDFIRYDWMNRYSDAEIKVNFEAGFKGFGKELRPSEEEKIRD